jgi:hypothetical protein
MVSGASFNRQKDNSSQIQTKFIADAAGKKAQGPGSATLIGQVQQLFDEMVTLTLNNVNF